MAYILTDDDVAELQKQNDAAIKAARADGETPDEKLAHLYALKAKLAKIAEKRGEVEDDGKPAAAKKAGSKRGERATAATPG